MLAWNTFKRNKNGGLSREDVYEKRIDYGKSVTDKSKYNPNISSFISNMGSIRNNPLYDFDDGMDTGVRMSLFHDKSLDITEKEAIFARFKAETENRLNELEELLKAEAELDKLNKAAAQSGIEDSIPIDSMSSDSSGKASK